jgi:hypothetical protein
MKLRVVGEKIAGVLDRPGLAWFVGVALPILMVLLDPAIFRGSHISGAAILGVYKPLGYVAIALGITAVALHLRSDRHSAVLAGVLAGASIFGCVLGVAVLPFSVLGTLFFGIGLLGLSPFVSSLVVGWRARKAYRASGHLHRPAQAGLGLLFFLTVSGGSQWGASEALKRSLQDIHSGSEGRLATAVSRLRRWQVLLDLDLLVNAWTREQDAATRDRLAAAYQELTGDSIAERANAFVD